MKNNIFWFSILLSFLFIGCFEDEGKYDYRDLNAPVWQHLDNNANIDMTCRAGDIAKFRASQYIKWESDSVQRASEVRYEWKLNGVVIGEEADFDVETDTIIKKINLIKFDSRAIAGTFSIIDKETGIAFMRKTYIYILPRYASGDWIVLSEKNGNAKCSFVKRLVNPNTQQIYYELDDDTYANANGEDILGKPFLLSMTAGATNISSLGSVSVFTDQGVTEINCENMMKVGELKDGFSTVPENFNPLGRLDAYGGPDGNSGLITFVTSKDGKLYSRQMTKNNLGGRFLSEPMVVDSKGYRVIRMGQARMGFADFPFYDELNRRILIMNFYDSGDGFEPFPGMIIPTGEQYKRFRAYTAEPAPGINVTGCATVWDMPVGTKVLHMAYTGAVPGGMFVYYAIYTIVYNDASGKTRLTEFAFDANTGRVIQNSVNKDIAFPGGNLDEESCVLTASYSGGYYPKNNYIFYSKGHEIRYVNKTNYDDHGLILLEDQTDKVTYMGYSVYNYYYYLVVCTEKGKLIFYDVRDMAKEPAIVSQFDLGGRGVACKELDNINLNTVQDQY